MDPYWLGVDLGTTWTAAAVWRHERVSVHPLSQQGHSVPSAIFMEATGNVLVGHAALRRGIHEPEKLAREFKRRFGDTTPIMVGRQPWAVDVLMGKLLAWVVAGVTTEYGGPPEGVTLAHPANWREFKLDLLEGAARRAGVDAVHLVPEPVAAASWYVQSAPLHEGDVVAIYDLGGGTFDATVLRRTGEGFEVLGRPDGLERLGGMDFDEAVLRHVWASLGDRVASLDTSDPVVLGDVAELRVQCV